MNRSFRIAALFLLFALLAAPLTSSAQPAPESFAPLVKKQTQTVVNISTKQVVKVRQQSPFGDPQMDESFYRFFGAAPQREQVRQSLGSGFIISDDGYILTNNHVVDKATDIKVAFSDGRILDARLVGKSPEIDIALIKVEARDLQPATLGDSDGIDVGDWVVAIGNPFGLSHTVTAGIVSAKGRVIGIGPFDNLIQTDAAINPGNSGGPLFNSKGEVVGINPDITAALGMSEPLGAIVTSVVKDGPADKAGLKRGDVIVELDCKKILDPAELPRMVAFGHIGKTVMLKIFRQGKPLELKALVEMRPAEKEKM